jgi:hypothetical protein
VVAVLAEVMVPWSCHHPVEFPQTFLGAAFQPETWAVVVSFTKSKQQKHTHTQAERAKGQNINIFTIFVSIRERATLLNNYMYIYSYLAF